MSGTYSESYIKDDKIVAVLPNGNIVVDDSHPITVTVGGIIYKWYDTYREIGAGAKVNKSWSAKHKKWYARKSMQCINIKGRHLLKLPQHSQSTLDKKSNGSNIR